MSNDQTVLTLTIQFSETNSLRAKHLTVLKMLSTKCVYGGARGVIVIVVGNEHSDTSSNPGRD